MRRYVVIPLILLLLLMAGCADPGDPAETQVPTPAEESDGEPLLAWFGLDPEGIDRISYSAVHFGKRTLERRDEGFREAVGLLATLRGTPARLPRGAAAARELRINDDPIPLVLEYDGEWVYADLGYAGEYLLLEGRPDDALEAVFAHFTTGPALVPYGDEYREDGPVILQAERPICDGGELRAAVADTLLRLKEPGPKEGTKTAEGAIVRLIAENQGEEAVMYSPPRELLVLRDGTWYRVPFRISLSDDLIPRWLAPGESLETGLNLSVFDDPLGPGFYRAGIRYTTGEKLKTGWTHIAWAEFEITG